MNIIVACVGSIKEDYYTQAVAEYVKRLSRYHKVSIIEVPEAKCAKDPSSAEIQSTIIKECEALSRVCKGYVIALDKGGQKLDSISLSTKLNTLSLSSSTVTFVIGGSYGLTREFVKSANMSLSFSDMTFPHQLMRVILLEQLYRATTITKGITYHK